MLGNFACVLSTVVSIPDLCSLTYFDYRRFISLQKTLSKTFQEYHQSFK